MALILACAAICAAAAADYSMAKPGKFRNIHAPSIIREDDGASRRSEQD